MNNNVPTDHPRYKSLSVRHKLIDSMKSDILAEAGLIAHGRGEAFDYILGEKTPAVALKQERMGVLALLLAENPVISVNGNVTTLCPREIVQLAELLDAKLEVNLFYRTSKREQMIQKVLEESGAKKIYGLDTNQLDTINELSHKRRIVDKRGIMSSDCVFVPLEDGDRTMALRRMEKEVVTIDLNPMSRTSLWATVTIVNELTRAVEEMIEITKELKKNSEKEWREEYSTLNNDTLLRESLNYMVIRLKRLASEKGLLRP